MRQELLKRHSTGWTAILGDMVLTATRSVALYAHNWRERRKLAKLLRYDEFFLDDIGLRRDDIHWVLRQSLDRNPACLLRARACERKTNGECI